MATPVSSQRTSAGFIYVLKPQILVNGQEVIKIGMTTRSVAQRVRELTTGSMVPFEVVFSLYVVNARQLEKQLHARYRSQRLVGGGQEFFHVSSKEVVGEIERIATEISKDASAGSAKRGDGGIQNANWSYSRRKPDYFSYDDLFPATLVYWCMGNQ
jgi:hypothetical protein